MRWEFHFEATSISRGVLGTLHLHVLADFDDARWWYVHPNELGLHHEFLVIVGQARLVTEIHPEFLSKSHWEWKLPPRNKRQEHLIWTPLHMIIRYLFVLLFWTWRNVVVCRLFGFGNPAISRHLTITSFSCIRGPPQRYFWGKVEQCLVWLVSVDTVQTRGFLYLDDLNDEVFGDQ